MYEAALLLLYVAVEYDTQNTEGHENTQRARDNIDNWPTKNQPTNQTKPTSQLVNQQINRENEMER